MIEKQVLIVHGMSELPQIPNRVNILLMKFSFEKVQ